MSRPVKLIAAWMLLAALLLSAPSAADASGGKQKAEINGDQVEAEVNTEPGPPPPVLVDCEWLPVDAGGETSAGAGAVDPQSMEWGGFVWWMYVRTCDNYPTPVPVWIPQLDPTDLIPALHDRVSEQLHHPELIIAPEPEPNSSYVQVPIDFRTTPQDWEPIVLTASVPGPTPVWVTITAEPDELWFYPGDPANPQPVGCDGQDPVASYDPATPGACSYTYRNASTIAPGDRFAAQLAITWNITYVTSSNTTGTLTADPTTTTTPLFITEIKALITCTGPDPLQGAC